MLLLILGLTNCKQLAINSNKTNQYDPNTNIPKAVQCEGITQVQRGYNTKGTSNNPILLVLRSELVTYVADRRPAPAWLLEVPVLRLITQRHKPWSSNALGVLTQRVELGAGRSG